MQIRYTTIKVRPETWKQLNSEREIDQTMDDVLAMILEERQKLKRMFKGKTGVDISA
jgi:hypothetical protein